MKPKKPSLREKLKKGTLKPLNEEQNNKYTPLEKGSRMKRKIDDSKTLTEVLKSYANRVLALVKEFYEKAYW